jgi:hypothetical protein
VVIDMTYIPDSRYNLLSVTKIILNRWTMSRDINQGINMGKGSHEINFGKTMHPPKGVLYVAVLKR